VAVSTILYGTSTAIPCTLASLAGSSATAGQGCAAVDNTSNKFDDALLTIAVKTSASALANDKACYVYLWGSEDGTVYNASSAEAVGTNASVTIDNPTNMRGPFPIGCPAVSQTYRVTISVATAFGGILPRKWGFVLVNFTGQALDSTEGNHQKTYTGVTETIA
jgi:hypothetical protein